MMGYDYLMSDTAWYLVPREGSRIETYREGLDCPGCAKPFEAHVVSPAISVMVCRTEDCLIFGKGGLKDSIQDSTPKTRKDKR